LSISSIASAPIPPVVSREKGRNRPCCCCALVLASLALLSLLCYNTMLLAGSDDVGRTEGMRDDDISQDVLTGEDDLQVRVNTNSM
jgi:hypothetical protein